MMRSQKLTRLLVIKIEILNLRLAGTGVLIISWKFHTHPLKTAASPQSETFWVIKSFASTWWRHLRWPWVEIFRNGVEGRIKRLWGASAGWCRPCPPGFLPRTASNTFLQPLKSNTLFLSRTKLYGQASSWASPVYKCYVTVIAAPGWYEI